MLLRRSRTAGIVVTLVFSCSALHSCSDDGEDRSLVPMTATGACEGDVVDALGQWGAAGFSGVLVVDAPQASCAAGVGFADVGDARPLPPETVFAVGSVSKSFVATAVLGLEADGALSLDDPAGRFVDGLRGPVAEASIRSLLLHASGLVGSHGQDHVALSRRDAVAALSDLPVDEEQRGRFLYSNAGYTTLALVIEGASGVPYRRYVAEHVLPPDAGFWDGDPAPAGERAVGYVDGQPAEQRGDFGGPHWALDGNGDLAMTPSQLASWTRSLFTGEVVPSASVELALEPALDADDGAITVGWVRLDDSLVGEPALASAGGGGDTGQNVVVVWLPVSQRSIVVASNRDRITAEDLLRSIGPAIAAGTDLPGPGDRIQVDDATLERAAGTYAVAGGGHFDVTIEERELVVVPDGRTALGALLPTKGSATTEVADHERAVMALLAGETAAGIDELTTIEAELGEVRDVRLLGSTVEEGELRSYVELELRDQSVSGWYALNGSGGIEAVDLSGLPSVRLVPAPEGFRVEGDAPGDDALTVTFDDDGGSMTVHGPGAPVVARRR